VGTVIQYPQRHNANRHQRWERLAQAEQFARYGERKAQGMSQRQEESARLAHEMPRKDITMTQDETLTGGLC